MFRHLNSNSINGTTDDFDKKIDQSIRYFQVPVIKEKEDVLNSLLSRIDSQAQFVPQRNNVIRLYYSVASVAAAVLIIFASYFFLGNETFYGEQNASNVYYLPDNSRVILTEGSQLKYSRNFFNRVVKLNGEAYFEVDKSAGAAFYVKTSEGGVLVLGTRFSVSDLNKQLLVQCYQGVVGVDYYTRKVKITEGMEFIGIDKAIDVTDNSDTGYPYYAIFNYSCQNMALNEIWPLIENYFGVEIIDTNKVQKSFTGSINTGNVAEVVDIICTSMELNFNIADHKKIVIEPKKEQ